MQRSTSAVLTAVAVGGLALSVGVFAFARDATWRVVPYLWLLSVVCAWTVRSQGESNYRSWANVVLTVCVIGLLGAIALVVIVLLAIGKNGFPA